MKLESAIKQETFPSERIKAGINLNYTVSQLSYHQNRALKPYGLSVQQFNILRILRGQKGCAVSIKELSSRMIDKMSNASRLVEKLRAKTMVERSICEDDRRSVNVFITHYGLEVLQEASDAIEQVLEGFMQHMPDAEIKRLNLILDLINQPNTRI